jgi:hypothetical protein
MESTTEKKAVIIYAESTPNPASIKFVANVPLNPAPAIVFTDAKVAKSCPLALELFNFPFELVVIDNPEIKKIFPTIIYKDYDSIITVEGQFNPNIQLFCKYSKLNEY